MQTNFRFTDTKSHFDLRFFIAFASMIYTFIAMCLLKVIKRKTLFLIGILISWAGSGMMFLTANSVQEKDYGIIIFASRINLMVTLIIVWFSASFWLTTGPTMYVYCSEVLTDKGMSIATFCHWFLNTVTTILPTLAISIAEYINQIDFISANTIYFFIFSGLSIFGFFMVTIYIKETKDRSKSEISMAFREEKYFQDNS